MDNWFVEKFIFKKGSTELKRILLTERDKAVLKFINEFGFCEIRHIQEQFRVVKRRAYRVMNRLIAGGLVQHQTIFHKTHGVYLLTEKGAKFGDIRHLKRPPHNEYDHHLLVLDVYQKLIKVHKNFEWISERRLDQNKSHEKEGKKKHIADGMMLLGDKKVAIEIELTNKAKDRLKKIIDNYTFETDVGDEVWYFCNAETISKVRAMAERRPFIKVIAITDFLNG
jgi:hypothetical protein